MVLPLAMCPSLLAHRRRSEPPRPRTPERAAVPPPADPAAGLDGKIPATERSGLKPGCESRNSVSSLTSSSRQRAPVSRGAIRPAALFPFYSRGFGLSGIPF